MEDKNIQQLVEDILKISDNTKEKDYLIGSLLHRLAYALDDSFKALNSIKDTAKSSQGSAYYDGTTVDDCEALAQEGISNLLTGLFGD